MPRILTVALASWDTAKAGFADAYRDLRQAYDKAAGEFRK